MAMQCQAHCSLRPCSVRTEPRCSTPFTAKALHHAASHPKALQHSKSLAFGCTTALLKGTSKKTMSGKRGSLVLNANLTVKEPATGVEFPLVASFWEGEKFRNLGAGVRSKKIAFIGVKVYAVSLFVEAEKAARELGVRARGGFFDDNRDDDYCLAIVDGAFHKLLWIELVRNVEGQTFFEAFNEALGPRMQLTGETATLNKVGDFFGSRNLEKGTSVLMMWRVEGVLEFIIASPGTRDFSQAKPDLRIESPSMCRAIFEVYLGSNSVVPDAKSTWAEGTRQLLDSENVRRETRKGGGG